MGNETQEFNVFKAMKFPSLNETFHSIDIVEPLVCEEFEKLIEDHFETCIALSWTREIEDFNLKDSVMRLDGEGYIF